MFRATVVVSPLVSWLGLAMLVEPWRIANRLAPAPVAAWDLATWDGAEALASNGMAIPVSGRVQDIDETDRDAIVLYTSEQPEAALDPALLRWLHDRAADPLLIAGVDTGAEVLASAGLLTGHLAALHFEEQAAFRDRHRDLEVAVGSYNIDGRRATCAGGTATLDFSLALLARFVSETIAAQTAEVLIYDRRAPVPAPLVGGGWLDPALARAIHVLADGPAEPGLVQRAASAADLSPRQLQRRFVDQVGMSPLRFASDIRMRRARALLSETGLAVSTVAFACGYSGASEFARAFRRATGTSPGGWRAAHRRDRPFG